MFANRFTALVDACVLAGVLKRDLLLSLAATDFFRVRWTDTILSEAERAIQRMMEARGRTEPAARAARARRAMETAFADASVTGYESLAATFTDLPDPNDAHVIAAAVKTRASVIVTDNLKHFPEAILRPLDLEAKSADSFIADTIDLDPGVAIAAVRRMRERFVNPARDVDALFLEMEIAGLTQTVDVLRPHGSSL